MNIDKYGHLCIWVMLIDLSYMRTSIQKNLHRFYDNQLSNFVKVHIISCTNIVVKYGRLLLPYNIIMLENSKSTI